jgi:hypothetical protein
MKRRGPLLALFLLLAALVSGVAVLFQLRLAQGDVFPPYSSLRADPLGTRALHDSLVRLGAVRVERGFRPLAELPPTPPRTIILTGVRARSWKETEREEFDALDAAVRAGSRLVIAFRAEAAQDPAEMAREKKRAEERERREKAERKKNKFHPPKPAYVDLYRRWGANVKDRVLIDRGDGAVRSDEAAPAATLPERIAWRSDLYFDLDPSANWHVLYRRGAQPVLGERRLGLGSIVLAAESYFLSNEALQNDRSPALLAWIVGPHARVVFDEAHLGVEAQPGIAALARRYGLAAAFYTLLLLAALFVWRRMALFVPPVETADELALTYHPAAGLEALLRRAVTPDALVGACTAEWKPTARETDRARVERALAAQPKSSPAAAHYNAAVRALRRH